ncbi:hypothetical protein Pfo_017081 [Paulownia fortunei]|nr:hypothetical protein Pfo_017081 [Paulownia fortunei]
MDFGPLAMCVSQDWIMGSVLGIENGFCFQELQPRDRQRKELHPLIDSPDGLASSSSSFSLFGSLPVAFVQSLSSDLEKQRLEMDWFLELENQRLRSILLEETRQQAILLQKYESRIHSLILQKDGELTVARNKTTELQDFLKGAEMEAKAWRKKAAENEAIVCDLNNRLNRVREIDYMFPNAAKEYDAVSFCDSSSSNTGRKKTEEHSERMACKLCKARSSCVVFFPCRHLCCCKSCDALSGQCPVCETVKETSLEVFLF